MIKLIKLIKFEHRQVGRAVTRSSLERLVSGSNLGSVKSATLLRTARHRCTISSNEAVLPGCNNSEMGSPTRYTLRRNAASLMKDVIRFDLNFDDPNQRVSSTGSRTF